MTLYSIDVMTLSHDETLTATDTKRGTSSNDNGTSARGATKWTFPVVASKFDDVLPLMPEEWLGRMPLETWTALWRKVRLQSATKSSASLESRILWTVAAALFLLLAGLIGPISLLRFVAAPLLVIGLFSSSTGSSSSDDKRWSKLCEDQEATFHDMGLTLSIPAQKAEDGQVVRVLVVQDINKTLKTKS